MPVDRNTAVAVRRRLADDDALEYGHEVLDVDEGVLAAVYLKRFEGFHYQLPQVFPSLLAVVYSVSEVVCGGANQEGKKAEVLGRQLTRLLHSCLLIHFFRTVPMLTGTSYIWR